MKIIIKIDIFKEDNIYVALSSELNLSSFGNSAEEARESFKEAVELFIQECENMGTLTEVLEESGFSKKNDCWALRKPIAEEELALAF